ncbi:Stp1/IreP family PP2C-type Ser/Thr phosphatase [Caloranaerobacter azorensis]|uniref:Stp1/IreP family PP2C-type Ser/Thr phosphatase n=1 Tax=Caloranaerobacter azorensis TaxID=116090 RepID=A0A6P1YAZ4_9FIRM|nr:Stp1/IreP family PP2C-type Ser/Thr phosphatase [Caloranaerobacter azorensis]QIB26254.1 Stp1/IreP family PP2C-type Ser/Thr phosphatase [Caloranaerobacter azorensis]
MDVGFCTDTGIVREINQDSYYCSDIDELPLFVVADGMGGQNAGEVASMLAISTMKEVLYEFKDKLLNDEIEIPYFINLALSRANYKIYKQSLENERFSGMGTTVTLAFIKSNKIYIGHVGDSRAYLIRESKLIQLTQDHSLVAELVRNGSITEEEAINHPQKNIITRAIGTEKEVKVDITSRDILTGDIIILCTDGLSNMVSDKDILKIMLSSENMQEACDKLTYIANERGGFDNTTVLAIRIE